jgi:hypothetical protein
MFLHTLNPGVRVPLKNSKGNFTTYRTQQVDSKRAELIRKVEGNGANQM